MLTRMPNSKGNYFQEQHLSGQLWRSDATATTLYVAQMSET